MDVLQISLGHAISWTTLSRTKAMCSQNISPNKTIIIARPSLKIFLQPYILEEAGPFFKAVTTKNLNRFVWELRDFYQSKNGKWLRVTKTNKTILVSSVIHSARPTVPTSSEHCFLCFVLLDLKSGDGRTDGQHVRKQWSLPAVTVGWPSGSI